MTWLLMTRLLSLPKPTLYGTELGTVFETPSFQRTTLDTTSRPLKQSCEVWIPDKLSESMNSDATHARLIE
jgi:hypothetical protein